MDILNVSANEWIQNEEECLKRLLEPETYERITLVNANELHKLKDGMLVRFRGMIQDMYGPEYYLEKFEVVNQSTNERTTRNGRYVEMEFSNKDEKVDIDNAANVMGERQSYVVVSTPGVNKWVQEYESEKYSVKFEIAQEEVSRNQNKRTFDEAMDVEPSTSEVGTGNTVKKCSTENQVKPELQRKPVVSPEHILNHPLGDSNAKVCHVKVYKTNEDLKLNEVYDFVGFLSINPVMESFYNDNNEEGFENEMEVQTHHPPSSLVPRIHVVHFKALRHNNPLLDIVPSTNLGHLSAVKKELAIVLTQLLLGDALAAEYLICHLISEVYLRRDVTVLGKFSVNISHVPNFQNIDYVSELYKFLELLLPKSYYLPLSLENMNTLTFIPKKDYECNRITSGILQLSPNTNLVLDETKLKEGKLEAAGVQAVKALADAIKNQKVTYDFKYYPIDYHCNIPFLIFSEGKSMLPSDMHVPLSPDEVCLSTFSEIVDAAKHFLKPELLNDIRKYLTQARLIEYDIPEQVQELVQQEFVNMRQNSKITGEDLHSLLVLARLLCISEGKCTLDSECWKKACDMELQRKARLN